MRHVGVDLGKRAFTVCFLDAEEREHLASFPMTPAGLGAFRAQLRADDRLALEVGPNAYFFYDQVRAVVAEVVLVSPRQFAVIAKSPKKTDRQDARTLARFLKLGCLPTVVVPDPVIRDLRQLFATRDALVRMTTQLKNIGHAVLVRNGLGRGRGAFASPEGRRRLAQLEGLPPSDRLVLELVLRQLDQLEAELLTLERAILRRGRQLPGLKRLLQVRGLSLLAAIGVLAEIGDIGRFPTAKQLVAYAGLASRVRQSGATDRHGRITKEGRTRLRGFLVQAVLSLVRDQAQTPLRRFYERKRQEKGAGKAICATARKLLTVIFVLLTKRLDYWYLEERLYQRKLKALAAVG